MIALNQRRSPSPSAASVSHSAYALQATRQLPRYSNSLFGNTQPAPPPGLAVNSTLPSLPPGLPIRPSMINSVRSTSNSPPRFATARNQSQGTQKCSVDKVPLQPVSREESIRQTEPQASPSNVQQDENSFDDMRSFNSSPSTEANRIVAFSVAECALQGDDEDDGIDMDHRIRMIERRMTNSTSPKPMVLSAIAQHTHSRPSTPGQSAPAATSGLPAPVRSDLSAAAPSFQFKPKFTLPWEEAEAKKVGMDILSYQNKQMFVSQGAVFRPEAITIDTTATGTTRPTKTLTHSRSRSDIPSAISAKANNTFVLNTPIQPSGSFAQPLPDIDAQNEQEAIALLPPPRCITPQPFKRPSFAEAMLMPPVEVTEQDNGRKRNALPTLAEISARYKAGKVRAVNGEDKENDAPVRPKRYSLDSSYSASDAASSVSSGPSLPTTPRRSRLPAFLRQHSRSDSSGSSVSDDIVLYSPTKLGGFMDELPQTPICPTLRVTPPSVAAEKVGAGSQRQHEGKKINLDTMSSLPMITCTPATAPGLAVSPLAMLEGQIKQNKQVEKRQERAQLMMSALQRRNRGPGVSV